MGAAGIAAAKRTRFVFTDSALNRLPSIVKKDTDYYDEKTPGLICRVLPPRKGYSAAERRVFYYRRTLWVDGKKKRPKVKMPGKTHADKDGKVADARRWAKDQAELDAAFNKKAKMPTVVTAKPRTGYVINDLLQDFVDWKVEKKVWGKDSRDTHEAYIRLNMPLIGTKPIELLTPKLADQWLVYLRTQVAETVGPRVYSFLKNAIDWAKEEGKLERSFYNLCDRKFPPVNRTREKILTFQQLCFLWFLDVKTVKATYKPTYLKRTENIKIKNGTTLEIEVLEFVRLLKLIILTGARKGQIENATWGQYKWHVNSRMATRRRVLDYSRAQIKTKNPYIQALPLLAQSIIDEQRKLYPKAKGSDKIFPTIKYAGELFAFLNDRLEMGFGAHTIRTTCTTCWSMLGIPLEIKEKLLHHEGGKDKKRTINKHYDMYDYFHEKQMALDLWERHLRIALESYDAHVDYDYTNNEIKDYLYDHGTITTVSAPSLATIEPKQSISLPAYEG